MGKKMKKMAALAIAGALLAGLGTPLVATPKYVKAAEAAQQKRNVMYYGDWSIWGGQGNFYPKDIPAEDLTHLNYAFIDFDENGNLLFTDNDAALAATVGMPGVTWGETNAGLLSALTDLRAKHPNLKLGISLGGWSKSGDFARMAASDTKRAAFVANVMKFTKYMNFDFVDIDWEYPGSVRQPDKTDNKNDEGTPYSTPQDKENFIKLLTDLRSGLDTLGKDVGRKLELSVALPISQTKFQEGIDIPKLFSLVDFANIMTYDANGAWSEVSGHQSALYSNPKDPNAKDEFSIDKVVAFLKRNGAPSEKIVVGAAYYTRGWEKVGQGVDTATPGLFGKAEIVGKDADFTPSRGAKNEAPTAVGDGGRLGGVWSYRNLAKLKAAYPGLKEYWDDVAKAPYLYDPASGAFFTYDNVRSIQEKTKYVNDNNLGGMIAWMASQDKETGGTKRNELTHTTRVGLFGSNNLSSQLVNYKAVNLAVTVNAYKDPYGNNSGYDITIKNNEALAEKGTVLAGVENFAETVKLPKVYIYHNGGALSAGEGFAGAIENGNGYTALDFKGSWNGKFIAPGGSVTFKVRTAQPVDNTSAISSMELTQRSNGEGKEYARQVIFTNSTQPTNTAPVLTVPGNVSIEKGTAFNALTGVSANDKEDGDVTSKVVVAGAVDTAKAGSYTLTYSVADSKGLKATATRVVTVTDSTVPPVNTAPVLTVPGNVSIEKGTAFNALTGVSANDKEDGDVTSKVVVAGAVDTAKAGSYTLTYSVADSKGLTATATRVVTVTDSTVPPVNTAPVLAGVKNQTFDVGTLFNPLAGVTATDKEDGDLTSAIVVSGTVDIAKAGNYTLTYSVKDKGGLIATAQAVITVKDKATGDTFDPNKIYVAGDKVVYNGVTYVAQWWTQGGTPDTNSAWKKVAQSNDDGSLVYQPGTAYTAGQVVSYNGKKYRAKWWTNTVPGSDGSWELVG